MTGNGTGNLTGNGTNAVAKLGTDRVLAWRLSRQLPDPRGQADAGATVRRLCGVQAQVASAARLAVATRQLHPRPQELSAALTDRTLVKTWAMRGTLHLTHAADTAAYLSLVAAARTWEKGSWQRAFVTTDQMAELIDAVCEVLDGRLLSRTELVNEVIAVHVEGVQAYARAADVEAIASTAPNAVVRLLPAFDQYVLGPGTNATWIIPARRRVQISRTAGWISPVVVARGRVAGTWGIADGVVVVVLFSEAGAVPANALDAEVARLSSFLGTELRVLVRTGLSYGFSPVTRAL